MVKIHVQSQWRVVLLWYHISWQSSIQRGRHTQLCIITSLKWIIQICLNSYCWVCKIAFFSDHLLGYYSSRINVFFSLLLLLSLSIYISIYISIYLSSHISTGIEICASFSTPCRHDLWMITRWIRINLFWLSVGYDTRYFLQSSALKDARL